MEQILICGILELEDSQEQALHKECKIQRVVVRSLFVGQAIGIWKQTA